MSVSQASAPSESVEQILHRIVKANDVRGLVATELSPAVCWALGSAFATVMSGEGEAGPIVLGHDMRESALPLVKAFAAGVRSTGQAAESIGLCSTDALYFASGARNVPAVMFTASHNPAGWNGLKLCRSGARPVGLDSGLDAVRDLAITQYATVPADLELSEPLVTSDLLADYAAHLRSLVDLSGIRPLKIVVDAGNGMAGLTAPAVFGRSAGLPELPIEMIELYFELDGTFPNHEANPLEPKNLVDLQAAVREYGADLGLAFDGDADRCFVVDEFGDAVSPSAITALVAAREIAKEQAQGRPGAVIHNLITSSVVPEVIAECGAQAVRTKVGHAFIKAEMAATNAVFGGEHSAHYYFRDFWYADTGMLAALHVLAALGEQPEPLSAMVAQYNRYVASGEINSTVTDVPAATAAVIAAFEQRAGSVDHTDGVTVSGPAASGEQLWWFNLRPSNTEPLLRLNVEAGTVAGMEALRDEVLKIVRGGPWA